MAVLKVINFFKFLISSKNFLREKNIKDLSIAIISKPHTIYIAHLLQTSLMKFEGRAEIIEDYDPKDDKYDLYFIICPQTYKNLPSGRKRICYQLEQSVRSNWFKMKYLLILNNSLAIYDYSLENLDFLDKKNINYPSKFYMPISFLDNYVNWLDSSHIKIEEVKKNDLLFYGDASSPRRKKLLSILHNKFNIIIRSNLYGDEMRNLIANTKVVVNLHFYENALLETTRIFEALSLGACVVSETSVDIENYPLLLKAKNVNFFDVGDDLAMIESINNMLEKINNQEINNKQKPLLNSQKEFEEKLSNSLNSLGLLIDNPLTN